MAEVWREVDEHLTKVLSAEDEAQQHALRASREAGLPEIAVSALQGKLLAVLVQSHAARRVLEIGTLGGYSTIGMARALPSGGEVVTLEINPKHAEVARANFAHAGVSDSIRLIEGAAVESLSRLAEEEAAPFDLVFIDANKDQIPEYLDWAIKLSWPGALILVDNVVRKGAILDRGSDDGAVQGCQRMFDMLADDARVSATVVQTVGSKGHDGIVMAVVL